VIVAITSSIVVTDVPNVKEVSCSGVSAVQTRYSSELSVYKVLRVEM
jgi:hypothetical protein